MAFAFAQAAAQQPAPPAPTACVVSTQSLDYPATIDHGPWPDAKALEDGAWIGGLQVGGKWIGLAASFDCQNGTNIARENKRRIWDFSATYQLKGRSLTVDFTGPHAERVQMTGSRSGDGAWLGKGVMNGEAGSFSLWHQPAAEKTDIDECVGAYESAHEEYAVLLRADADNAMLAVNDEILRLRPMSALEWLGPGGERLTLVRDYKEAVSQFQLLRLDGTAVVGVRRPSYAAKPIGFKGANAVERSATIFRPEPLTADAAAMLWLADSGDMADPAAALDPALAHNFAVQGFVIMRMRAESTADVEAALAHLKNMDGVDHARIGLSAFGNASSLAAPVAAGFSYAMLVSPLAGSDPVQEAALWKNAAHPAAVFIGEREPRAAERAAALQGTSNIQIVMIPEADQALTSPVEPDRARLNDDAIRNMGLVLRRIMPPPSPTPVLKVDREAIQKALAEEAEALKKK